MREIPLEPGAYGVLLTVSMDRATRYSADLRQPVDNSTACYPVAEYQVRASTSGTATPPSPSSAPTTPVLALHELSMLTAWAEGVSEAAAYAPERIDLLLAAAAPGRYMAGRARPTGAVAPARRCHRVAGPNRSSGPRARRCSVVLRPAHDSQPGRPF